jgi:AmmeMemoRadiSam system protein A
MSTETNSPISASARKTLLEIARKSILYGLETGSAPLLDAFSFPDELQAQRASFVTLHLAGELRGCIGHLEAFQALVVDVSDNAFAAAFRDPRFPPLSQQEYEPLQVHISVLTPPEPLAFESEADLLSRIRPGIDGLILEDGPFRGTFLPSVWESLPQPDEFLRQLKRKAGLPADHWSDQLHIFRYETESFGE